jgi:hypothetical protein
MCRIANLNIQPKGNMNKPISWEDALQIPGLEHREIKIQEPEKIYRGPIKRITCKGDDVYIHLLWCAHNDIATDKWRVAESETAVILKRSSTKLVLGEDRTIVLMSPEIIVGTIFAEGAKRLDPNDVEGLDLNNLPGPIVVQVD